MFKHIIIAAAAAAYIVPAFAAEWVQDFDTAKAKAAQEGKAILADFTGSDWCGWCIRLRQTILDTPEFETYAKKHFILAEIDLPRNPAKLSPQLIQKNKQLCEQYHVDAFPTLLVMDAQGRVAGGFSGGKSSLQDVQAPLNKALENIALLQKAATQQGQEKLQTLLTVYNNFPDSLRSHATEIGKEIVALDPTDSTGMRERLQAEIQKDQFIKELSTATSEAQAMALLERMKDEALAPNKSIILMQLFTLKLKNADSVADLQEAKQLMLRIAELTPGKKAAIEAAAEKQFANPEDLLMQIRAFRNQAK